jgi:hypothetical protein
LQLNKSGEDVRNEFLTGWDNLKEDEIVKEENFTKFYIDVSSCIETDEDFIKCLNSFGFGN